MCYTHKNIFLINPARNVLHTLLTTVYQTAVQHYNQQDHIQAQRHLKTHKTIKQYLNNLQSFLLITILQNSRNIFSLPNHYQ